MHRSQRRHTGSTQATHRKARAAEAKFSHLTSDATTVAAPEPATAKGMRALGKHVLEWLGPKRGTTARFRERVPGFRLRVLYVSGRRPGQGLPTPADENPDTKPGIPDIHRGVSAVRQIPTQTAPR